jgi:anthranilate synthase component II
MPQNVLLIDNHDSFTYNLVQVMKETGLKRVDVCDYKDIGLTDISGYNKVMISPGAGIPSEYPVLKEFILRHKSTVSILGICLGHQAIAEAFGQKLSILGKVNHGKCSRITLTGDAGYIFDGIPRKFCVGLYHSWVVSDCDPSVFNITALGPGGIIMGLSHVGFDIHGVQFHPESYMTEFGKRLLHNWIKK